MFTEDDLFEEYCRVYWDEAVDRFLEDSGDLFNLLADMTQPEASDDPRMKALERKNRLIVCGIATEAIMRYNKKPDCLSDEIGELEDTLDYKDAIKEILHQMWDNGDYFQEFNEPDYE